MKLLDLTVISVTSETPGIRSVVLVGSDGDCLPGWTAGAHADLHLPSGETRSYSLVNLSPKGEATQNPVAYRLGVRLAEVSQGGSSYIHALRVGDRVRASPPINHFALVPQVGETVLLAGGIGITPIASMAAELAAGQRPYRLIYAGRTRSHLAFLAELNALCGSKLLAHCDDVLGVFDIAGLMSSLPPSSSLYVCGPAPLLEKAISTAVALGWEGGRLHFEIFNASAPVVGDTAFQVVLSQTGNRVTVAANQTILDALLDAGELPSFDCRRGDCGLCQATVLDGVPEHRDFYLSDKERVLNKLIQICVSRAKTPLLVLDM